MIAVSVFNYDLSFLLGFVVGDFVICVFMFWMSCVGSYRIQHNEITTVVLALDVWYVLCSCELPLRRFASIT